MTNPNTQPLAQDFALAAQVPDAARYFFEAIQYYPEFEKSFNRETQRITSLLGARR